MERKAFSRTDFRAYITHVPFEVKGKRDGEWVQSVDPDTYAAYGVSENETVYISRFGEPKWAPGMDPASFVIADTGYHCEDDFTRIEVREDWIIFTIK